MGGMFTARNRTWRFRRTRRPLAGEIAGSGAAGDGSPLTCVAT